MRRLMHVAALVAGGLVVMTGVLAVRERAQRLADASHWRPPGDRMEAAVDPNGQCSIYHARFGGTRARLVRIARGHVANYVVIEVSRGSRALPSVQRAWLRGAFGEGEMVWLGEFASPDTALNKAARLCPETARCRIGEPDCGPDERPFSINVPREI